MKVPLGYIHIFILSSKSTTMLFGHCAMDEAGGRPDSPPLLPPPHLPLWPPPTRPRLWWPLDCGAPSSFQVCV
jgi:hypothetical protein